MILSRIFLFPYWLGLKLRNAAYDRGCRKAMKHTVPVVSVGNLTAGGTGKTPMTEYLCALLRKDRRVAVLSRGYKRKSHGFQLIEPSDPASLAGDEPLQVKRKFPDVLVAVDKNRNHGVAQLMALPEAQHAEIILLDDGFQYRKLQPDLSLLLVDYNRPVFDDELLPLGHLRDLPEQLKRADAVIVTKTPKRVDDGDRAQMRLQLHLRPGQPLFFTSIRYLAPQPVFPDEADARYLYSKEAFLFTGVADDRPLRVQLVDRYPHIEHKRYNDHHTFTKHDQHFLRHYALLHPRTVLLTTEKDAMRLLHCPGLDAEVRTRLFYIPIETQFQTEEEKAQFERFLLHGKE